MPFPDFSSVKFVPPGNRAKLSGKDRTDLYKLFDAVVNNHALEVDQYQLEEMFIKDLSIDTKKYDKVLVGVLAETLVYFMTRWPGWEKSNDYYSGKIQCREWYEKFKNYLMVKSTFVIHNASKYSKIDKSKNRIGETQVDLLEKSGSKRISPYVLNVGAPPDILNNVVFVESEGNICIKQHNEKAWPQVNIQQLLNWPYVITDVQLPDISITRSNTHQMHRYLSLTSDPTVFPEVDPIRHVNRLPGNESRELQPYSYDFFSLYFKQLIETLMSIPEVNADRVTELEVIFSEFLLDLKEVNLYNNTMCPYLSVAFNIGKCKYIRNKRVNTTSSKRNTTEWVNFYEIVIPEIDFSLNYFNAVQDDTDCQNVTFASLNILKNSIKDNPTVEEIEKLRTFVNEKCVKYQCTLCAQSFPGSNAYTNLHNHFKDIHKCEQTLLCSICHYPFEVADLTSQRWKHKCN